MQRQRLESGLSKATEAIKRLIGAYQEQLITLDELRSRMPELRNREAGLRQQIEALNAQLADREIYLTLADNVENFLTGLKNKAATASIAERQRVLRLLVKDVLVSPDKITIRHSIPVRHKPTSTTDTDQEGESSANCQLRWRSHHPALRSTLLGRGETTAVDHTSLQRDCRLNGGTGWSEIRKESDHD